MFGFMAGHAMLETARDALFLANWPASQLPWVYLGIAVFALALSRLDPAVMTRLTVRGELSGWLVLASLVTLVIWVGTLSQRAPTAYPLYIWTGVIATLVVVRFWTLVAGMFTVTQAKRLFAVIGSGSIAGAITGSGAARVMAEVAAPRHLVLGAASVFALTSLAPRLMGTVAPTPVSHLPPERWHLRDVAAAIRVRPYLRAVAVLVLLSTITFTFVDFVFKSRVGRLVPAAEMGTFFSSFYLVLNTVSLAVQLVAVGWLLRRVSVHAVHTIAPSLLLVGSVGTALSGALPAVLLLKGVDGALRHSLSRTTVELLFVPVRVDLRSRVKVVIDTIGQRGGQALASLAILVAVALPGGGEIVVTGLAALAAATWLGLSMQLRQPYVETFRETLRDEVAEANIAFPELDVMSLEMLLRTLNDPDDRRVHAALDLLVAQGKAGVIPALILFHPSAAVVVHALDIFQTRRFEDALPIVNRLLEHSDPTVVAAAVRTLAVVGPDPAVLRRALDHPSAVVVASALVGLAHTSALPEDELAAHLPRVEAAGPDALIALCDGVRVLPVSRFDTVVTRAANHPDARVRRAAVRAMGAVGSPAFVPVLLHLLVQRDLRADAATALLATGPSTLDLLNDALRTASEPLFVRRQIPLAMVRFASPRAARLLLRQLIHETDGLVRFKIIRALNALRRDNPDVALDTTILGEAIRQTVGVATAYARRRHVLNDGAVAHPGYRTPGNRLLCSLLRDKEDHALERVFRLLNLLTGDETFARIHRSLTSDDPAARANARELALHLAPEEVQRPLITLVDDLYDPEVTTPVAATEAYLETITNLLDSPQESLATMAVYHVGELGLSDLAPQLTTRTDFSDEHADVVADVRARLAQGNRS